MNLPGYDAWKTRTPEDDEDRLHRYGRRLRFTATCQCCGERYDLADPINRVELCDDCLRRFGDDAGID